MSATLYWLCHAEKHFRRTALAKCRSALSTLSFLTTAQLVSSLQDMNTLYALAGGREGGEGRRERGRSGRGVEGGEWRRGVEEGEGKGGEGRERGGEGKERGNEGKGENV